MKITEIRIEKFVNLNKVHINFHQAERALVVGPNGSGKSNIVKTVARMVQSVDRECPLESNSSEYSATSSIELRFRLNEDECRELLTLRFLFVLKEVIKVIKRCVQTNNFPAQTSESNEVMAFLKGTFVELHESYSQYCQKVAECIENKTENHVVVSWQPGERSKHCKVNLTNIGVPINHEEEYETISKFFEKKFGEKIMDTCLEKQGGREEREQQETIGDRIRRVLNLKSCFNENRHESQPDAKFSSLIDMSATGITTKLYYTLNDLVEFDTSKDRRKALNVLVTKSSISILAQNCWFPEDQQDDNKVFWSMPKVEQRLANAFLSKERTEEKKLQKVEEAMHLMGNILLKVTTGSVPGSFSVLFKNPQCSQWQNICEASAGERELLMVLTAIHLSGADNIFLDDLGHSLHPPKQAQLRRWLETSKENQVLFAITHSSEMISKEWLGALYHMYRDHNQYSAACLGVALRNTGNSEPPNATTGELASGDLNAIKLDAVHADFLMSSEMRHLFFSSGAVFVEGNTDKRIIEAMRSVQSEHVQEIIESREQIAIQKWCEAYKEMQMDQFDVITINGSANWLKAYQVAENLKIPFVVVLDADVLKKKSGSSASPLDYNVWQVSPLRNRISEGSVVPADHILAERMREVDQIGSENTPCFEQSVYDKFSECNIWIWQRGDIEAVLFDNEDVRQSLLGNSLFTKAMESEDIGVKRDLLSGSKTSFKSEKGSFSLFDVSMEKFRHTIEEIIKNSSKKYSDLKPKISETFEKFKTDLNSCLETGTNEDPNNDTTLQPTFGTVYWEKVKQKLHKKGKWKFVEFEVLKEICKVATDVNPEHPLNKLWQYVKKTMYSNRKTHPPPLHVFQERFSH